MSRVINPNAAGKDRNQLMKAAAVALHELIAHSKVDDEAYDLAAFIAMALRAISAGIETSVTAWEKRGYWLKADRFRLDWEWTGRIAQELETAPAEADWGKIATLCVKIGEKVEGVQVAKNHRLGTPWSGAWRRLRLGGN